MSDDNTNTTPAAGSGIVFGLAEDKNSVAGVHLQNLTFGEKASTADALNEDGEVEQVDVYAKKVTVQGDGNVVAGASLAVKVGATLTIGEIDYVIDTCDKKFSATGHCSFSFSGSAPMPADDAAASEPAAGN